MTTETHKYFYSNRGLFSSYVSDTIFSFEGPVDLPTLSGVDFRQLKKDSLFKRFGFQVGGVDGPCFGLTFYEENVVSVDPIETHDFIRATISRRLRLVSYIEALENPYNKVTTLVLSYAHVNAKLGFVEYGDTEAVVSQSLYIDYSYVYRRLVVFPEKKLDYTTVVNLYRGSAASEPYMYIHPSRNVPVMYLGEDSLGGVFIFFVHNYLVFKKGLLDNTAERISLDSFKGEFEVTKRFTDKDRAVREKHSTVVNYVEKMRGLELPYTPVELVPFGV